MYYNYLKDIEYVKVLQKHKISSAEFAEFLGVSRMTLNRWIKEESYPGHDKLEIVYNNIYASGIRLNRIKEEFYQSSLEKGHILLFHGSKYHLSGKLSTSFSDGNADFGKGFYLGETYNQSAGFIVNFPRSSIYIFDFDARDVRIKEFNVSEEWMLLITYFRGKLNKYKDSKYIASLVEELKGYDVIVAPIADNLMYTTLDDFISGKITDLQCVNALSANRLGKQYVFLNDVVINNCLKIVDRCYYCQKERDDYSEYRLKENEIGYNKVILALREYAGKGKYIEEILK